MPAHSPKSQKPGSSLDQSILIQLSQAEYRCPRCNAVVVKVEGNELKFLMDSKNSVHASYTSNVKDGDDVYIVVQLHHIDKPDTQPGH